MKKIYFLPLLLTVCVVFCGCPNPDGPTPTPEPSSKLWPVYDANAKKWGYMNEGGQMAISAQFIDVRRFSGKYALVQPFQGVLEFIDAEGNRVAGVPQFIYCSGEFHNGYMRFMTNSGWGMMNNRLEKVIDPLMADLGEMGDNGFISCRKNPNDRYYSYININKEQMIEPLYEEAGVFTAGAAVVVRGGQFYAINKSNNIIYFDQTTPYDCLVSLGNSRIAYRDPQRNRQWGMFSTEGGNPIGTLYKEINSFTGNGLARVMFDDNKYGYIDKNGVEMNLKNGHAYKATDFQEGIAYVKYNEASNYVAVGTDGDTKFELAEGIIPYSDFSNGLSLVWKKTTQGEYEYYYINAKGTKVGSGWIVDGNEGRPIYAPIVDDKPSPQEDTNEYCWEITYRDTQYGYSGTFYLWATRAEVESEVSYYQDNRRMTVTYRQYTVTDEYSCKELSGQEKEEERYIQKIFVNDGTLNDWKDVPQDKIVSVVCPENATLLGLKSAKIYADEKCIFIQIVPDAETITDRSWVPFHVYINTDNSDATGGYSDEFTDPNADILLEGAIYADGDPCSYAPGVFKWWGPAGETGWDYWIDPSVEHSADDNWGAIVAEGELVGTMSQNVNGVFEIQIMRELIPATWNKTEFGIGFDILQNWGSVGVLPLVSPTNVNPNGYAHKIKVKINK